MDINKFLNDNDYTFLRYYIERNLDDFLKMLKFKSTYKSLYLYVKNETGLNITYRQFCRILSEIKKTAHQKTPEKNHKVLAAKILETQQQCDATQTSNNNEINEVPIEKLNFSSGVSRLEKLKLMKNEENKIINVQKDEDKFVWQASIKKETNNEKN